MSFANMSPAERMKASGLIGLIVVILFFVVHTMMGAIAPKTASPPDAGGQQAAPAAQNPQPSAQATATAPAAGGVAAGAPNDPFPTAQIAANRRRAASDSLALNIADPFLPMRGTESRRDSAARRNESPRAAPPSVDLKPESHPPGGYKVAFPEFSGRAPILGSTLPPLVGSGASSGGSSLPASVAPPPEPEIRVVGVVHGEPSVATLQVSGRVIIARPGDALARGWRLINVDAEGVQIRHGFEQFNLRVGAALNEDRKAKD